MKIHIVNYNIILEHTVKFGENGISLGWKNFPF